MRPSIPTELVPAALAAEAVSAAALLGGFTYVVAQATAHGPDRRVHAAKSSVTKAAPPTATVRASP